jgi:capsular polysaccharide export protein
MLLRRLLKRILKRIRNELFLIYRIGKWLSAKNSNKPTVFVFGVSKWKQEYIRSFLSEFVNVYFVPINYVSFLLSFTMGHYHHKAIAIWGITNEEYFSQYSHHHKIPLYRIEDGFVRSVGLGAMHTPPFSICVDKKGIYFDSTKPSDLEDILNHYDFQSDPQLLERARKSMQELIHLGLSKYNHVPKKNVEEIYGRKTKWRILVIGQVEDDASIRKGSSKQWTNYDLVQLAYKENPEAEIIYKPHPDVLTGKRPSRSNLSDAKKIAKVIEEPLSLADSFKTVDHVYTITSLSGFEALIRGITVTTLGAPFYSGWGITDDRQAVPRRKRKLTVEEIFAGAYLLYPRYMDPETKESLTLEDAIKRLLKKK